MLGRAVVLAFAALVVAAAPGHADPEIKGKKGGQIKAVGPGGKAVKAKIKDICILRRKTKTIQAFQYEAWVRDLICDYIEADFGSAEVRNGYVAKALAALRAHAGRPGLRITADPNIVHVVTTDPAYAKIDLEQETWTVVRIKTAQARRSWSQPDRAAIGLNPRAFFPHGKPPNTMASVRKAEHLLRVLVALKKMADLIHQHPEGYGAASARVEIRQAMQIFQSKQLIEYRFKSPPGFSIEAIEKKPDQPYKPRGPQGVQTLPEAAPMIENDPAPGEAIKAADVKAGDLLGLTVPVTGFFPARAGKMLYVPDEVESVEPRPKLKPGHVARAVIRTVFIAHTYYGRIRKGDDGTHGAITVTDLNGKPCTDIIRRHERKHASDAWAAWRTDMLGALRSRLDDANMTPGDKATVAGYFEKDIHYRLVPSRTDRRVTFVDLHVAYFYGRDEASKARKAAALLKKLASKKVLEERRQAFLTANKAAADAFHKKEEGLDPMCRPIAGAKAKFGEVRPRRSVIKEAP